MSAAAIAGGVIGGVVGVAAIVAAALFIKRRLHAATHGMAPKGLDTTGVTDDDAKLLRVEPDDL